MTLFIAFGHKKRVGKDTAGRFLSSHLRLGRKNSNIQTHGYADKGKAICHDLYGWAGVQSAEYYEEHPDEKEIVLPLLNMTPRELWIEFMSHAIRDIVYDMTWVDYLLNSISCDVCIVKDLRFPLEADSIHAHKGFVYRIDRDAAPNTSDTADDALLEYDRWDGVIENNGTLAEFNSRIAELAQSLLMQLPKGS